MRISDIIRMAQEYLALGIIAALLMAVIFCIGYFIIYKKILHGLE